MDRETRMRLKLRALRALRPKIKHFANKAYWTIKEYNKFKLEYCDYKSVAEVEQNLRHLMKRVQESNDVYDSWCSSGGLRVNYEFKDGYGEASLEIELTVDACVDTRSLKPVLRKKKRNTLLEVSK